jgi:hypothetical protein
VVRQSRTESGPEALPIAFGSGNVGDACFPASHHAALVHLPPLMTIPAVPWAGIVVPLVLEAHADPVVGTCPQNLHAADRTFGLCTPPRQPGASGRCGTRPARQASPPTVAHGGWTNLMQVLCQPAPRPGALPPRGAAARLGRQATRAARHPAQDPTADGADIWSQMSTCRHGGGCTRPHATTCQIIPFLWFTGVPAYERVVTTTFRMLT